MKNIQLLYARNTISRESDYVQQNLEFFMLVKNLAYNKQVEVSWAGEDGYWRKLEARYHGKAGRNREIWRAQAQFQLSDHASLPGDVEFALSCRVSEKEYWDNNRRRNYTINADSGIQLGRDVSLQNIEYSPTLYEGQQFYPIRVAVRHSLNPKQIYIHWTTDRWRTTHVTPCFFMRKHWDKISRSNARNPNRYDCAIWISQLQIDDAYRLDYAIACETDKTTIWDNNHGRNYIARHDRLKVLTLNLHCYQEADQEAKFRQIARAIKDLDIDIVCLQEVGEHWNNGHGDWNSNAAKIIRDHLGGRYHLYTDWSHIGFDRYREGIAVLSKHHFLIRDAGYVSPSQDVYNIHARKVVMVQIYLPYFGLVNIFSAHLSWLSDGFLEQFERLRGWANQKHGHHIAATLVCGDFNIKASSEGYAAVVNTGDFEDQYLKATSRKVFDKVFRRHSHHWGHYLNNDHRIDYIFMKTGSNLAVASANLLFTEEVYGSVSDHYGYYAEFEPRL